MTYNISFIIAKDIQLPEIMFHNLKQDGVNDYSLQNLFTDFSQTFVHVWTFLVDIGKLKR
jgi:hypothetical protein